MSGTETLLKPSLAFRAEILGHQSLRVGDVRKKPHTQRHLCLRSAECHVENGKAKKRFSTGILPGLRKESKEVPAPARVLQLNSLAVDPLDRRDLRVAHRLSAHHIRKRRLVHKSVPPCFALAA